MKERYSAPQLKCRAFTLTETLADLEVNASGDENFYSSYIEGLEPED